MTETISLEVKGKVPIKLLGKIYREITPKYIKELLAENGMPTDKKTVEIVAYSYETGFPTQDLALKAAENPNGMKFWGIASGYVKRPEKVAVKYLILEHIQEELAKNKIPSEINIADINPETIEYMEKRGIFKEKLPKLRKIAERRGNAENIAIGLHGAANTPIPVGF